jgi:hypothetical protein
MFFQQMKRLHEDIFHTSPTSEENFFLGAVAAAASVTGQRILFVYLLFFYYISIFFQ